MLFKSRKKSFEKALEVHGYTDEFLSNKKKFKEIVNDFLLFIKDKKLIIHNSEFDIAHINHELSILGLKHLDNEITDTLVLARDKFPGSSVSLDALCKRYRIDNSKRTQHTALIDCEITQNLKLTSYYKKIVDLTDDERKKHREYLSNYLKKNFF